MAKFYTYDQNNSGGSFTLDKENGLTHKVIIEAEDYDSADKKAESIGIYFNGVSDYIDCPCCGDRWSIAEEYEKPTIYSKTPYEYVNDEDGFRWMEKGFEVAIHYLDGKIEWL